jgi:hypothetical protein
MEQEKELSDSKSSNEQTASAGLIRQKKQEYKSRTGRKSSSEQTVEAGAAVGRQQKQEHK